MSTRPKFPDSEASEVFKSEMERAGVKPIRHVARASVKHLKPIFVHSRQIEDDRQVMSELLATSPESSLHDITANESCRKEGLSVKDFRKLQRGKFTIEDYIDLHGHTVAQAEKRISEFISESLTTRNHCIRIVHGKGLQSKDGIPKLKNLTYKVLFQSQHVLGYCRAPQSDGGGGATCVLLKPQRRR